MHDLTAERGKIKINMKAFLVGEDLCLIISGGEKPHIGCVTLSVARPSLSNNDVISSTTSILNLTGHKDDEAAKHVSQLLSSKLNKNVVVTCGIHIDNISKEEIDEVFLILNELTEKLIKYLM